jgi:hypothetical protein
MLNINYLNKYYFDDNIEIIRVKNRDSGQFYFINLELFANFNEIKLYQSYYDCLLKVKDSSRYYTCPQEQLNEFSFNAVEKLKSSNKNNNKPKIIKSKVVKEIKEDKYGTNLVLELRNQEIYLSNALLSYLDLKDGSKVNFASNNESNQNYLYIENEENEGYEIKQNIIVCPHNVILFKTLFGTDVLYLDIREENLAEEPSYVFYPIVEFNPQEIDIKTDNPKKSFDYYHWDKNSGNITGIKSSPVVDKISLIEEKELLNI